MNRIILIGNGFDLVHKMKTSYNDFINNYWTNTLLDIKNCGDSIFENHEIKITKKPPSLYLSMAKNFEELIEILKKHNTRLYFKNRFHGIINEKKQIQNWVDIENEYYELLKESFKNKNCNYLISELNSDFNKIQQLLELYLKNVENEFNKKLSENTHTLRLKKNIGNKIYSNFKLKDFSESLINKKAELEFQKIQKDSHALKNGNIDRDDLSQENLNLISRIGYNDQLKEIRKLLVSEVATNYFDLQPDEILFLNFNYTFTDNIYHAPNEFDSAIDINKNLRINRIHIHGTTNEFDGNDVVFGFGDEIDEDYKSIENLNDNNYLENIKSIKYLETDNYKKLLEFLNSGDYQIYIFGHSCGNSDRTLLSTLFEHKHCASIKPFYHKKDEFNDNYSDIVRNISRNFSNKATMRDKVVNKEYCEPLQ